MNNIGVLTSKQTPEAQEMYTPYYAVDPIMKYIPKEWKVWCPFDKEWSAFYQSFAGGGTALLKVILKTVKIFLSMSRMGMM